MFNLFRKPVRPSLRKQEVVARTYRIGRSKYTEKEVQELAVLLKRGISPWAVRVPYGCTTPMPERDANGYYAIPRNPVEGMFIEAAVGPMGDTMTLFEFSNGVWVIVPVDNYSSFHYGCGNDISPAQIPYINGKAVVLL